MKSFLNFFTQEFLFLESVQHLDKAIFSKIIAEDADMVPSEDQLAKMDQALGDFDYDQIQQDIHSGVRKQYLTPEKQLELIRQYKADPNSEQGLKARDQVIMSKSKYVYWIAHHLANSGVIKYQDLQDAYQIGMQALIEAIDSFDETKQTNGFTPYASKCINGKIRNPFNTRRSTDVADGAAGSVESLDSEISGDRGEWADKDVSMAEKVADPQAYEPGKEMNDVDEQQLFQEFLRKLPDKEALAIKLHFPEDPADQKTYDEIAKILGLTKMGAYKVTQRALQKLVEYSKEVGYHPSEKEIRGLKE